MEGDELRGPGVVEALFEREMTERQTRCIDRHRAESSLGPDKRLSSFDFTTVPSMSKAQVMALAEGHEWLDRGANVLLFGPPGVGKSHLVSALGHALIDAGRRVLFTRCGDPMQRLQAARRDLRLPPELAKLDRFDLLILDDLSSVRRDQAETSVLFELIAERYERRYSAVPANTPFSQWSEVFAEPAMTLAAVDRLVHHATILEINAHASARRTTSRQRRAAPARRQRRRSRPPEPVMNSQAAGIWTMRAGRGGRIEPEDLDRRIVVSGAVLGAVVPDFLLQLCREAGPHQQHGKRGNDQPHLHAAGSGRSRGTSDKYSSTEPPASGLTMTLT
jgi:DNA replication protein DnaC